MVDAAEDLGELQTALLDAYGDLNTAELTRLMAAAFALAELKGMAAVRLENVPRLAFAEPAPPAQPQPIHIHLAEGMVRVENHVQVPEQALPEVIVHNNVTLPEAAAPVIQNTINVPEAPAPVVQNTVNIPEQSVTLSLPARKTDTVVIRDNQGNITRATQVETDLP